MAVVSMRQFIEAGVHFGHQTRRWNPKMKPFIFGTKHGIHIIDLQKSLRMLKSSFEFVIRPKTPLSLDDARRVVAQFVRYYNELRLHSAIGYLTPKDRLTGQAEIIFAQRKRKLAQAQKKRRENRQQARLERTCISN